MAPLNLTIPQGPPSAEERKRDSELQHQLDLHARSWKQLYEQSPKQADGLALKLGSSRIPLSSRLNLWDLREPEQSGGNGAPDFSKRYRSKGDRFGLNWRITF